MRRRGEEPSPGTPVGLAKPEEDAMHRHAGRPRPTEADKARYHAEVVEHLDRSALELTDADETAARNESAYRDGLDEARTLCRQVQDAIRAAPSAEGATLSDWLRVESVVLSLAEALRDLGTLKAATLAKRAEVTR